jgi:hypothetical protein
MPSIVASHIYTMFAVAVVGAILIAAFNSYTTSIKTTSESEQLKNILSHVAAQGNELLTLTEATNSSTRFSIQLPAAIGQKQYWLRIRNDSSSTWIEGSFGQIAEKTELDRLFLPKGTSASGYFIGGYGPAILESYMNSSTPQLNLTYRGG